MTDISKENIEEVLAHYTVNNNRFKYSIPDLTDEWFDKPKYFVPNFIIEQLEHSADWHDGIEVLTIQQVLRILDLRHQINNHTKQDCDK